MYYKDGNRLATTEALYSPSAPPIPLPLKPDDCQPTSSHMYSESLTSPTTGSVTPGASTDFSMPDEEQVSDEINDTNSIIGQPFSCLQLPPGENSHKIKTKDCIFSL